MTIGSKNVLELFFLAYQRPTKFDLKFRYFQIQKRAVRKLHKCLRVQLHN